MNITVKKNNKSAAGDKAKRLPLIHKESPCMFLPHKAPLEKQGEAFSIVVACDTTIKPSPAGEGGSTKPLCEGRDG